MSSRSNLKKRFLNMKELSPADKKNAVREFFINNLLYILLIGAIVGIAIYEPRFLSISSIILSCLPILQSLET